MTGILKRACRMRSNIPPPAPEADLGAAVREPEKSRIAVDSIKLSLDGVTHLFLEVSDFREGIGVRFLCRIYGNMRRPESPAAGSVRTAQMMDGQNLNNKRKFLGVEK